MSAHAGGRIEFERRRVLQRLLVEAARFEPRGDANGNAGPAHDAIERVPAVVEQDAAARLLRIDSPVRDPVRAHRDRGLRSAASASGRFARRRSRPRQSDAEILRQTGA